MNTILKAAIIVSFIIFLLLLYLLGKNANKQGRKSTIFSTPEWAAAKPSASVQLHGEKTDVVLGEDVILKLSAVNLITKPVMTVQVILIPPSGMSVTSTEFVISGAGQYTTTYTINPGTGRDIEVRIRTNQTGDFEVEGRIVYYYGEDKETAEDHTLTLPIKVKPDESAVREFERFQKVKDAETELLIEQKESEADFEEAKRGIEALRLLKQAKAEGRKGEVGIEQDVADKERADEPGRFHLTENGSIIQRSNIGASTRRCPDCSREVEANEKFCLECGAKL